MASKGSTKGADRGAVVAAAAVDRPEQIRNVAVVGHSGSGKTTLVEGLLLATGTIPRAGTVPDGTTVSDADPAEVKQQRSVSLSVAPFEHNGIKVNLLDTPGYADFVGELRAGLRAADAAMFVVSSVDGVDATTIALWEECAAVGMPRAVVVTGSTTSGPTSRSPSPSAAGCSATTCCRSTCRCTPTTARSAA